MPQNNTSLLRRMWRDAPILTLGLIAALALVGYFAGRLALGALYWNDPRNQDVPLAAWMTPRFVAHSWHVPPEVIRDALGLAPDGSGRRLTLGQLADEQGIPLEDLTADLQSRIAAHRAAHP